MDRKNPSAPYGVLISPTDSDPDVDEALRRVRAGGSR